MRSSSGTDLDGSSAASLTKLASTGGVDALTSSSVKRNTSAFATDIAAGTHLWAGIRIAMVTTQPTIFGLDAGSSLFYSSPDLNPVVGPAWMHCIVQG